MPVAPGAIPIAARRGSRCDRGVLVFALAWLWRPRAARAAPSADEALRATGGGGALLLVLCAVAFVVWLVNPFAALLLVPALHLWLPIYAPGVATAPRRAALALVAIGLVPLVLVALSTPGRCAWAPTTSRGCGCCWSPAGHLAVVTVGVWSLFCACVVSDGRARAAARPAEPVGDTPITVRGPITYAGPGSLGGTESALRR